MPRSYADAIAYESGFSDGTKFKTRRPSGNYNSYHEGYKMAIKCALAALEGSERPLVTGDLFEVTNAPK